MIDSLTFSIREFNFPQRIVLWNGQDLKSGRMLSVWVDFSTSADLGVGTKIRVLMDMVLGKVVDQAVNVCRAAS